MNTRVTIFAAAALAAMSVIAYSSGDTLRNAFSFPEPPVDMFDDLANGMMKRLQPNKDGSSREYTLNFGTNMVTADNGQIRQTFDAARTSNLLNVDDAIKKACDYAKKKRLKPFLNNSMNYCPDIK